MIEARRWLVWIAMLAMGCGGGSPRGTAPSEGKGTPEAKDAPEGKGPIDTKASPEPTPITEARPERLQVPDPYVPTRALPEIIVNDPGSTCPELPALAADASEARKALHPHAVAVRRLACEPMLYGKTTEELRTELGLAPEAKVEISGIGSARLELPVELTVGDVAAVFGIATPSVHLTWQAYHARTSLGTNATTGAFDLWGPGRVWLSVRYEVDRYGDDSGKEKVLPAAPELSVASSISIGMPSAVVSIAPDPDAIPLIVTALDTLAAKPELLEGKPEEVAGQIGLAGERFRMAETSTHSGDTVTRGLSIDPRRTTVPAAALAAALGLPDPRAVNVNREHDVWQIEAGGTTEIPWKTLELEFDLSTPEDSAGTQPLGTLEVGFLAVMPRGS
ncbi:hypothetical protein [Paraliomyxa miuraensis]|uniref:hypothetical protein n=1 Tax=Paraliomyxa miuraensis TaxID=376150 RepID=UPI002250DAFE|nr:hypothetical protein [Paraliomyxa miuraensis]MCX4247685.1 hypothetical protein [Paraliomyxa miuraensis]